MENRSSPEALDLNGPPHAVGPAEVARILGIGERQARQFIADGRIYSFRVGRRVLVPKRALRALLEGALPSTRDIPGRE
jgi:excisionase family DNA binding protein